MAPWTTARYLVLDTETTGLDPAQGDRVVELAAHTVDLATGTVTPVFDQRINPGRPIPPEASAIHHLVDADVADAPPLAVVWAAFAPLLAHHDAIVAHHAAFDRAFLPPTDRPWICTLRLARHLWPDAPRHSNQVLRYWLGLTVDAPHPHRALDDTRVTAALFQAIVPVLTQAAALQTPADVAAWADRPILVPRVPFGQYRGARWDTVPPDYLRWAAAHWEDPDLRATVQQALTDRRPSVDRPAPPGPPRPALR